VKGECSLAPAPKEHAGWDRKKAKRKGGGEVGGRRGSRRHTAGGENLGGWGRDVPKDHAIYENCRVEGWLTYFRGDAATLDGWFLGEVGLVCHLRGGEFSLNSSPSSDELLPGEKPLTENGYL